MDMIDLGWVAGILDGEGSVTMDRIGAWRRPGLSVSSTDLAILERLRQLLGGSISKVKSKPGHKQAWLWKLAGGRQVLAVLAEVAPQLYCPVKAQRAKFILANYRRLTPPNGSYTDAMRKEKLEFERVFFELTGS